MIECAYVGLLGVCVRAIYISLFAISFHLFFVFRLLIFLWIFSLLFGFCFFELFWRRKNRPFWARWLAKFMCIWLRRAHIWICIAGGNDNNCVAATNKWRLTRRLFTSLCDFPRILIVRQQFMFAFTHITHSFIHSLMLLTLHSSSLFIWVHKFLIIFHLMFCISRLPFAVNLNNRAQPYITAHIVVVWE